MSIKYPALVAGVAFLAAALVSIKQHSVLFRTGYRLRRDADPFGYWGAVVSLVVIGIGGIIVGLGYSIW